MEGFGLLGKHFVGEFPYTENHNPRIASGLWNSISTGSTAYGLEMFDKMN